MVTTMHNQSMYSAIIGLSSERCGCGVMLDGPSGVPEVSVRSPRGSLTAFPVNGWPAVEATEDELRWCHGQAINRHRCMDVIVPLLSP